MRPIALVAFLAAATSGGLCLAEETPEALSAEVVKTLREKYADAALTQEKDHPGMQSFSRSTREFLIYRALKTGEWQQPQSTLGPDKGGLLVRFQVTKGRWKGALEVPYSGTEDFYVFKETHVVRQAQDGSCYIWAEVLTPRFDAPSEVAAKLVKLFNEFEKYLSPR